MICTSCQVLLVLFLTQAGQVWSKCGTGGFSRNRHARILGGSHAVFGEFPWLVSLQWERHQSWIHVCGASVLAPGWLLTAAHCKELFHKGNGRALAGCLKRSPESGCQEIRITAQDFINHPEYVPETFKNDIALIKLPTCFDFDAPGDPLNSICLTSKPYHGPCYVAGWGTTQERGGYTPSEHLMKVKVDILDPNICYRQYSKESSFTAANICAGNDENGLDSCQGDSGGPLMAKSRSGVWYQLGIVSYGKGCGNSEYPGVYTRVSSHRQWIQQYVMV